jgi:hypothetical protein
MRNQSEPRSLAAVKTPIYRLKILQDSTRERVIMNAWLDKMLGSAKYK